ncbi:MAG: hypothetical protein QNJ12_07585 [Ilumatobacter sp.]|uniref:hypothetical protein n=1 Tax=Ilumatobacter sp. TaxID=1967498 RepID=UPI00262279F2|nr:hypothetical protein [Ilumatobacter sp.]MDJ0768640.1 hypothetical protein [Ilumatobacter sp.]
MARRRKTATELGQHHIFGDEEAAQMRADLDELRGLVATLQDRLHSQFTTIAAHAEIARDQAELARNEARADLDRTRDTLIELIEQVRGATHHVPGSAPGASFEASAERIAGVEGQVGQLTQLVDHCFDRQRELADTMVALLDTVTAASSHEPVVGLALS